MTEIDYGRLDALEAALGGRAAIEAAYAAGTTLIGAGGPSGGAAMVTARAYLAVSVGVAAGWQKVPLDTASFGAGWDLANHRYVASVAGTYHASALVSSTDDQVRLCGVYVNGVARFYGNQRAGGATSSSGSDEVTLAIGDQVELWVYSAGGTALQGDGAGATAFLSLAQDT